MLFPGATTPFGMVALSPDNLDHTGWYKMLQNMENKSVAGVWRNLHC